jgi:hypothetical protein
VYQARGDDYLGTTRAAVIRSPQDAAYLHGLAQFLGMENEYLSTVLGWYALSYRQPVLRTPQLAAGLFGQLQQLRTTYDGGNSRAFNRDLQSFTTALNDALPAQDFLRTTPARNIKLISDLPLEWLPLLFQRNVSRMPITPGNGLFAQFNQCSADLLIGPEEVRRVLVLNCLAPNDRLYHDAEYFSAALRSTGIHHSRRLLRWTLTRKRFESMSRISLCTGATVPTTETKTTDISTSAMSARSCGIFAERVYPPSSCSPRVKPPPSQKRTITQQTRGLRWAPVAC